ncbi:putative ribonuclease H-like domain-containing protein [Tanacetum coccineum]|uniref:Ribonuclease H-like domain-containing protein n=1 Tax=Tanacetum coccineum TaxID=301880 RepID=A0ABQ4X3S9_9ASTR
MDVKSAFLYERIEEEVYVCQPLGFEDLDFPDRVYKVEKALYGLHQAPRAWYETLSIYLLDNGFEREKIDKTLFIRRHKGDILLVQVYVDDIIFSQDKYVGEIQKKFRFTEVKTASTPMETQKPLLKDEDGEEVDVHMYRSMIGSLMYLTSSRPDIMFVVCACARYQVNPKVSHSSCCESDYAEASLDRKSTTGGCQFFGCRLISWQCKKQTVVANSTTEAEYVAASSCCGQATFKVKTVNGEVQLQALVDGKKIIITESTVRRDLQLEDAEGVDYNVADEAVNEEMDDSLVRAATTATSLDIEQDRGNINKTQSKATLNEQVPQDNSSRVLALETTKTTQATEIASLKKRVKKLERRNKSRTYGLKRLYRVGSSRRTDEDMFGVNDLDGDEVIFESVDVVKTAEETRSVVKEVTAVTIPVKLKSAKPKADKVVIQEPEHGASSTQQFSSSTNISGQGSGQG